MACKKIREYDSKRLLKEHFKRLCGRELPIKSAQVTESTDFNELAQKEPWLSSCKFVINLLTAWSQKLYHSIGITRQYFQKKEQVIERD
ncbi:hypothetical protein LWI29_022950 [Acer saccharum]|uniref:Uncharacterized protein n=1 Tax=Acer saccharum TaxID=4024 RepID=A0AA39W4N1_ACESA|nr:hypothetical protein LWI29_022950 [Acer saccharum]